MTQTARTAYPELAPRCTRCDIVDDDLVLRQCKRCRTETGVIVEPFDWDASISELMREIGDLDEDEDTGRVGARVR